MSDIKESFLNKVEELRESRLERYVSGAEKDLEKRQEKDTRHKEQDTYYEKDAISNRKKFGKRYDYLDKARNKLREGMSPEHQAKMQKARAAAEAKRKPSKEFYAKKEKENLDKGHTPAQARRSAGIDTHQFNKSINPNIK